MVNEELELIARTFNSTQHPSNQTIALSMLLAGGYELEDLAKHFIGIFYYPDVHEITYVNIGHLSIRIARKCIDKRKWYKTYPVGQYTLQIGYDISSTVDVDYSNLKSKLIQITVKVIKEHETSPT